jgi:hypothetical protein
MTQYDTPKVIFADDPYRLSVGYIFLGIATLISLWLAVCLSHIYIAYYQQRSGLCNALVNPTSGLRCCVSGLSSHNL